MMKHEINADKRRMQAFGISLQLFLKAIIFIFAILPAIYPKGIIDGTIYCLSSPIELVKNFNSPIYVVIGLTISIISIAYMIGTAYSKPEWAVWARTEAINLAWSIVLVGVILSAFASSCTLANLLVPPEHQIELLTPAGHASNYMQHLLDSYGASIASQLVRGSIRDQMASLKYAYWSIPAFDGGGLAYAANQRAWASHKDLLADIYLPLMISIMAQKLVLDVAIPGVFSILLPAAIFLRMLFLTRDIGNLLLALSFSIYFALPLVYVFFFDATSHVQKDVFVGANALQPFGSSFTLGYDTIVGDYMQRIGFMAVPAILAPNLALVVTVSMTMALQKAFRGMVA
jgi:hypothetical protein